MNFNKNLIIFLLIIFAHSQNFASLTPVPSTCAYTETTGKKVRHFSGRFKRTKAGD
jgi:hypothetical protein